MQIKTYDKQGAAVFELAGRIDSAGAVELDQALHAGSAEGKHKVILDMGGVSYINSAGLRTLADILTRNQANGGGLRLVGLNPKVERVFKIIGFDKFFEAYGSVDAALTNF
ncbi:MAG: STAS domain-containing protein [Chloroflexi bacterium]|nr:STAS domain-containing protein [Chloroflexota bacterium]